MKEYAIWGVPPKGIEEALLLSEANGQFLRDKEKVNDYIQQLEKLGCTKVRIQTLDLSKCFGVEELEYLKTMV